MTLKTKNTYLLSCENEMKQVVRLTTSQNGDVPVCLEGVKKKENLLGYFEKSS